MKKILYTILLAVFTGGTLFTSCNSSGEKVDAAKANIESAEIDLIKAKEAYYKEYNELKYESDKKIAENAERISELRKNKKKMEKDAEVEYEKTINDLERRNDVLKAKIESYKDDSKDAWESFKREFSHDMEELGQSLKDLTQNNVK